MPQMLELSRDYTEKLSIVCSISILLYGRVAKLFELPSYQHHIIFHCCHVLA